MQAPPDFAGVPIMTASGAASSAKDGIRPQRKTPLGRSAQSVGSAHWPSEFLKSPTVEASLAPVKRLATIALDEVRKSASQREIDSKIAKLLAEVNTKKAEPSLQGPHRRPFPVFDVDGDEPQEGRTALSHDDPTPASLGQLLIENPNGILVNRDEIVSLLQTPDREDTPRRVFT